MILKGAVKALLGVILLFLLKFDQRPTQMLPGSRVSAEGTLIRPEDPDWPGLANAELKGNIRIAMMTAKSLFIRDRGCPAFPLNGRPAALTTE